MTRLDSSSVSLKFTHKSIYHLNDFKWVDAISINMNRDQPPSEPDWLLVLHPRGCDRCRNICFHAAVKSYIIPAHHFHTLWSCYNYRRFWEEGWKIIVTFVAWAPFLTQSTLGFCKTRWNQTQNHVHGRLVSYCYATLNSCSSCIGCILQTWTHKRILLGFATYHFYQLDTSTSIFVCVLDIT